MKSKVDLALCLVLAVLFILICIFVYRYLHNSFGNTAVAILPTPLLFASATGSPYMH